MYFAGGDCGPRTPISVNSTWVQSNCVYDKKVVHEQAVYKSDSNTKKTDLQTGISDEENSKYVFS